MLYLRQTNPDGEAAAGASFPLSESAALKIETALLAADAAQRIPGVVAVLDEDANVASWAKSRATADGDVRGLPAESVAGWLSANLARLLSEDLVSEAPSAPESTQIEWRLPALASRLARLEHDADEFDRRLEHEKLEAMKELAYGASHEINNPLANIAARAQTLLEDEADAERRRRLVAIHRQAMRAHEMISDLMLFARPPKLQLATVDLRSVVRRIAAEHSAPAAERHVELRCEIGDEPLIAEADETQLGVALGALVANAIEAVGESGTVRISLRHVAIEGQESAEIAVSDNGLGIRPEIRDRIFDPFFSGREAGRGLGFGLSKCWRIVTDHGGRVVVLEPTGGGACFAIRLAIASN